MKKIITFCTIIMTCMNLPAQNIAPEWSKDKVIYEVNIRQYTGEGTFEAFSQHLPRLKELGAGILWLMPVQPIGVEKRKGSLGSYYSISDYTATNPEFGTMKEFKKLVDEAHKNGMYVILDWVANHSSFDNVWMKKNKDFYTTGADGKIIPPVADWSDVADFNYDNMEMRRQMIEAMKFWLKETGVDGFRCDVAMMVPDDFWKDCFTELKAMKPDIFLLAEAEGKQFIEMGFHMVYGWKAHHLLNKIAQGKTTVNKLDSLIQHDITTYPAGSYWMNFTSNHDENSWNGSEFERMGDAAQTMAVIAATIPGMLLIYSGQEVALNRRLKFFDKDSITWNQNLDYTEFYQKLSTLKKENPALWNGSYGGTYKRIETGDADVFGFVREKDGNKILVLINTVDGVQKVEIKNEPGKYVETFSGKKVKMKEKFAVEMKPLGFAVMVMK
ncbi:MAG: alpha-amylase family glycosyl hydrolase [Chitinophagales bacterium]